jgi:pyridinium-3,5-bisthiocarboxylic acid mononucleotide nickel chelatase
MPKLAYLDCPTGIAGNMCLGALIDAGVPATYLQDQLTRLGMNQEYQLRIESVNHQGQQATQVCVDLATDHAPPNNNPTENKRHQHSHRHLSVIEHLIQAAHLPERPTRWALEVFRTLAIAEGAVHGIPPEKVHFHEVGATDAIVDIVGTCLGLDWLEIDQLYCSALPTGGGTVQTAHGQLSVPVPAVLKLWSQRQVPVYHNGIDRELVTPTGAAIATTLAQAFGSPPTMTLQKIGLGAGTHRLPIPNLLRLWIGESAAGLPADHPQSPQLETVMVLETQIDDLNPQIIGYTCDRLFTAGAVDVFTQPVGMKKSRPGILLTVICPLATVDACETVIFQETSTIGIRRSQQQRHALRREIQTVETPVGAIRVKVAWHHGNVINAQPEYEDCALLAQRQQMPWQQIYQIALQSWQQTQA